MWIFLFDIDGTLIHSGGAGRAALNEALRQTFAIDQAAEVPVTGRTDRGIAGELFTSHAIPNSDENWRQLKAAYLRCLKDHLPLRQGRVLPGVVELLNRLSLRQDVAMGLLTGNTQDGAKTKLEHYQLFDWFRFGGYGDQHADRNQVAHEALRSAQSHLNGHTLDLRRVWVIGDTPLDIRAARAIGARSLVVGTGGESMESLASMQPDGFFQDFANVDTVLERLFQA